MNIDDFNHEEYDALLLPGGFSPDYMRRNEKMLSSTVAMYEAGKPVAAICHGPWMMCSARKANGDPIIKGKRATCFCAIKDDVINAGAKYVSNESCVVDGNLITAQTPADLTPFCKAIIEGIKSLRIGGVPEHFNHPISMAIERRYFSNNTSPHFVIQRCGTGAMIANLKSKKLDVIVALTEGIVADIAKTRSDIRIVGTYVQSPLCWAISAGSKNDKINSTKDLKGATWGVSRMGSGSHLMATVLSSQNGWKLDFDTKFKVVGNFEKLRASVNGSETDAFMWETFTTKPFHDSGEVKRVGEILTPWPCFMIATRQDVVKNRGKELRDLINGLNRAANAFRDESKEMPALISKKYGLKLEDANTWYKGVNIVASTKVDGSEILKAQNALVNANVLTKDQGSLKVSDYVCEL